MSSDRLSSNLLQRSALWSLVWYLFLLCAGYLNGLVRLLWPGLFMLTLARFSEAWTGPIGLVLGAIVCPACAWLVDRRWRPHSTLRALVLGLVSTIMALALLLFVTWNVAEWNDWPVGV